MQQTGNAGSRVVWSQLDAKVEEALTARRESLAEVTHDARNMVAALGLYCELLEQPGVLTAAYSHYAPELRQVASASRQLVTRLAWFSEPAREMRNDISSAPPAPAPWSAHPYERRGRRAARGEEWDAVPVANLAAELLATRNLLAALAGPGIAVTVNVESGARATRISAEDLTRVLVNLVKNSVEAMPKSGRIQISLREQAADDGEWLVLTVEDSGPGIPEPLLERVFASGFSGHSSSSGRSSGHRGLGLSISRALVQTAGGRMHAENRLAGGARIVIELPAKRG